MNDIRTPLPCTGPAADPYALWDAAYVLGSLSAAERREFEDHMVACPGCREAVADLSGVPALLSRLDRGEVAAMKGLGAECGAAPELSPELLPSLLSMVRWRRRRSRTKRDAQNFWHDQRGPQRRSWRRTASASGIRR